mmetsp:Transcript_28942/g.33304  ORF Transcript_28942/g.33304 Transcript_28942/m.33304 type:complete len:324 (-) Transcript_28942:103-1074(-)
MYQKVFMTLDTDHHMRSIDGYSDPEILVSETQQESKLISELAPKNVELSKNDETNPPPTQSIKEHYWMSSEYAVGLVEISWADEVSSTRGPWKRFHVNADENNLGSMAGDYNFACGCVMLSGVFCSFLKAGRVGNMVVLLQTESKPIGVACARNDSEEELTRNKNKFPRKSSVGEPMEIEAADVENDLGGNNQRPQQTMSHSSESNTKLVLVLGPYWPVYLFITWPAVLIFSSLAFFRAILPESSTAPLHTKILWGVCTLLLFWSLFNVGFRDPGIMKRFPELPADVDRSLSWRWNDQAKTFRPANARYDTDCGCIIEDFDHV